MTHHEFWVVVVPVAFVVWSYAMYRTGIEVEAYRCWRENQDEPEPELVLPYGSGSDGRTETWDDRGWRPGELSELQERYTQIMGAP